MSFCWNLAPVTAVEPPLSSRLVSMAFCAAAAICSGVGFAPNVDSSKSYAAFMPISRLKRSLAFIMNPIRADHLDSQLLSPNSADSDSSEYRSECPDSRTLSTNGLRYPYFCACTGSLKSMLSMDGLVFLRTVSRPFVPSIFRVS